MKQNTKLQLLAPNGKLPISLSWNGGFQEFEIVGGPFDHFAAWDQVTPNAFGVCVRAERVPPNDLSLPIEDFNVPKVSTGQVRESVRRTIEAALEGKNVYVGCMGGWGRTGLFLALVAKACGQDDPVSYVRRHYTPRAVETAEQRAYVDKFDVEELRNWLLWKGWTKRWTDTLFWWAR